MTEEGPIGGAPPGIQLQRWWEEENRWLGGKETCWSCGPEHVCKSWWQRTECAGSGLCVSECADTEVRTVHVQGTDTGIYQGENDDNEQRGSVCSGRQNLNERWKLYFLEISEIPASVSGR